MSREQEVSTDHLLWLNDRNREQPDLKGQNLEHGVWEKHADLRWLKAQGANFSSSRMDQVYLRFSELQGSNFSKCSLTGTSLECARLKGASFLQADLSEARLSGADMRDCDIRGADVTRTVFGYAYLEGALWDEGKEPPPGWVIVEGKLTKE